MLPQIARPRTKFRVAVVHRPAAPPRVGRGGTLVRLFLTTDPGRLLAGWLVVRTVVWTAAVALAFPNPPLDLVEWLSWGGSCEWGYPKHPPLTAWVADLSARAALGGVWGVYLASYLATASCLWAAWLLGRDYLPPRAALVAALALDGVIYLTHDAAEFSNNVMLDAGWAWTAVCFHRAFRTGRLRWWAAVGLAVGLSLLVKYTIGVLVLAAAGYAVATPAGRRCLRSPGPYMAAAVATAVVAPHVVWLVAHDFQTIHYAVERSDGGSGFLRHLTHPLGFLGGQLLLLPPVAFVLWPLWIARGQAVGPAASPADVRFLHAVAIGPWVFLLALSAATGCQLRQIWGSPLWTFLGVWAVVVFRGAATDAAVRAVAVRWVVVAAGIMAGTVVKQVIEPHLWGVAGRQHFPGRELAAEVGRRWDERFPTPFAVVAGEGWRAGCVCCFAPHRPVLYSSGSMDYLVMEPWHSPWTGDTDLNARGGVILWDADQLTDVQVMVAMGPRFPRLEIQPPVVLRPLTGAAVKPTRVGLAFVPPCGP